MVSFKDLRGMDCNNDCANCAQSSLNCDGNYKEWIKENKHLYIQTFKPYFDVTLGREVSSKREIKEYCAKNDCVYAGDKELSQQCAQNKKENEIRQEKSFEKNLTEKLMGIC